VQDEYGHEPEELHGDPTHPLGLNVDFDGWETGRASRGMANIDISDANSSDLRMYLNRNLGSPATF
jgi:hypothetical protein